MLFDAHNHLHDSRLTPFRSEILARLAERGVAGAVVNGTRESDWDAVATLAATHRWIRPAFGVHPWHVAQRSAAWLDHLRERLDADPTASVGEIGLDRWIEGHDLADQRAVFTAQLSLATDRGVAASIHCIQAWGALWEILRAHPLPARGFLIHAYGGPVEMLPGFVDRGGFFSFSPYFLHDRKGAQRAAFCQIPLERLLVETDAPDLRPPDDRNEHPLYASTGEALNHPANLAMTYRALADLRGIPEPQLQEIVAANFLRLFG